MKVSTEKKNNGSILLLLAPVLLPAIMLFGADMAINLFYTDRVEYISATGMKFLFIIFGVLVYYVGYKLIKPCKGYIMTTLTVLICLGLYVHRFDDYFEIVQVNAVALVPFLIAAFSCLLYNNRKKSPAVAIAYALGYCVAVFALLAHWAYTEAGIIFALCLPVILFFALSRRLFKNTSPFILVFLVCLWAISAVFFVSICRPFLERHILCGSEPHGYGWIGGMAGDLMDSARLFGQGGRIDEMHMLSEAQFFSYAGSSQCKYAIFAYDYGLIPCGIIYLLSFMLSASIFFSVFANRRRYRALILPDMILVGASVFFLLRTVASILLNCGVIFNLDFYPPVAGTTLSGSLCDILLIGLVCSCIAAKARLAESFDKKMAERESDEYRSQVLENRSKRYSELSRKYHKKADKLSAEADAYRKRADELEKLSEELAADAGNLRSDSADKNQNTDDIGIKIDEPLVLAFTDSDEEDDDDDDFDIEALFGLNSDDDDDDNDDDDDDDDNVVSETIEENAAAFSAMAAAFAEEAALAEENDSENADDNAGSESESSEENSANSSDK